MAKVDTGNFASRNETISLTGTAGQVYDVNNINLTLMPACQKLASLYQYYRITSIKWRLKPNFDTYIGGGSGGTGQIPYLYFLFDKSGSLGNLAANQFEECGAVGQRVDDKTCVRRWRPSVLMNSPANTTGQFKVSPWMPTYDTTGQNLNAPNHLGAVFYVSKSNPSDQQLYDIDVTITVQFRKPLVPVTPGQVSQPLIQ